MRYWITTALDGSEPYPNPVLGEHKSVKAAWATVQERITTLEKEGFEELSRDKTAATIYKADSDILVTYGIIETKTRKPGPGQANQADPVNEGAG